jgi:hypothetical protein
LVEQRGVPCLRSSSKVIPLGGVCVAFRLLVDCNFLSFAIEQEKANFLPSGNNPGSLGNLTACGGGRLGIVISCRFN